MSAQWVVTFADRDREPDLVVADSCAVSPTDGTLILASHDGRSPAVAETVSVVALYPASLRASARRLPDPPGGGLYARARAGLRWLFT